MYRTNLTFVGLISIVIGNAIFPATDHYDSSLKVWGHQALHRVLERKPERADIVQALNILPADDIVSAFPKDMQARKGEARYLLEIYKEDQSHIVNGFRHCFYVGKKLLEVCKKVRFDQWETIPITLVARHPDISLFLIDRWVRSHNSERLQALMQQVLNGFMYESYRTHEVLATYFLSVPATELSSLNAQHRELFITYIFGALLIRFGKIIRQSFI